MYNPFQFIWQTKTIPCLNTHIIHLMKIVFRDVKLFYNRLGKRSPEQWTELSVRRGGEAVVPLSEGPSTQSAI